MYRYSFYQVARKLNLEIGRNTIFKILIEKGFIDKDHIPQQNLVDAGYLEYEHEVKYLKNSSRKIKYVMLYATKDGLEWLRGVLQENLIAAG